MNWFKYRLPNTADVVSGASHSLTKGLGDGFAVAPFLNPAEGLFTIPADFIPSSAEIKAACAAIPETTSPEDYFIELDSIIRDLDGHRGKTVAARVINVVIEIDIEKTFTSLTEAYPDAFIFAFSTQQTGTWIGASPELLCRLDGSKISTMALAGTRPYSLDSTSMAWDPKNIDEQRMVTDFILDSLRHTCTDVVSGKTFTKKAGPVEHICTPITATLTSNDRHAVEDLLSRLSPTPALCGSDRHHSLSIIEKYEHFDRELYGGFCGPSNLQGTSAFYVLLRAAKCSTDRVGVFSGSGITALSVPKEEWAETELKSKTIINNLKTSEK